MASNGQAFDSSFSRFPSSQQSRQSHHKQSLQGPPHAHSVQVQQYAAPERTLPPQAYRQQPFPPSQQLLTTKGTLPRNQNQAPRPAPIHVLPIPAVQTHRVSETNMNVGCVPIHVQHNPRRGVVAENNSYANRAVNSSAILSGHQTILERQPFQDSGTRPSNQTASYISGQNTNSQANGSCVMTNAIPPQQAFRKFMQDQNMTQNPIHVQDHDTVNAAPPFHEPLPQVGPAAQFPTNATSGTTNIQPSPRQRNINLSKDVEQAADRHAASILAFAFPALKAFQEAQHNVVRNVLLDLNSKYVGHVGALQKALRRSHQAEQEAQQKQKAALQASESIVAQAMKWKESLEDTRREFAILQERHEKLAQLALRQNKLLSADSSASSVATLIDRISYLEGRLTQYESVIPTQTEASSPVSAKERFHTESTALSSSTVQGGPFPPEKGFMMDGTDADKRRLQDEMNIVSKLVERKPKAEFSKPMATETVKEEPLTTDEENKSLNAPYIIDLTIDTLDQNGILTSSTAQVVDTEVRSLLTDPSLVMQNLSTSPVAGDEIIPSTDPSSSLRAAPPAESAPFRDADALKREQENEDDDDRARKRPRPENSMMTQIPLDAIDRPSLSPKTGKGVGDIEAPSSPVVVNNKLKEMEQGNVAVETDESIPPTDKPGKDTDEDNQALQLDPLYLQLIYHKYDSGITECRFCLMEIDHGTRQPDKGTGFPVSVSNDDLVAHAVSSHQTDVLHLSQLERTDVLAAFSKIMAAA